MSVDNRIVNMIFNNKEFEDGVAQSQSSLASLKKSLEMSDASKGLENLSEAANKIGFDGLLANVASIGDKFVAMSERALEAIHTIVESAVDMSAELVKSLSVDQISVGWDKYGQKTAAIQTIMAATGKSIEEVTERVDQLNWYTDETSYNLIDMTSNIGKFTSNGVDLDVAVSAMEGIANAAGLSGAGISAASHAMEGFSKAMGQGYMSRQNWAWIKTARMDTTQFKQAIIEAGEEVGSLIKIGQDAMGNDLYVAASRFDDRVRDGMMLTLDWDSAFADISKRLSHLKTDDLDKYVANAQKDFKDLFETPEKNISINNFEAALKDRWLDKDTMLTALSSYGDFTGALYEMYNALNESGDTYTTTSSILQYIDDYKKGMLDLQWISEETGVTVEELTERFEELSSAQYELGEKSLKASQEAKTLDEALGSVKDAVSTGWMTTFETIFGNYEEAKRLWTDLANELYEVFAEGGNERNEVLAAWKEMGGRRHLFIHPDEDFDQGALWTLFYAIRDWSDAIHEAMENIFPPVTAEQLFDLTDRFQTFTYEIYPTEKALERCREVFERVFTVIKITGQAFGELYSAIRHFLELIEIPVSGYFQNLIDVFIEFVDAVEEADVIDSFGEKLRSAVESLAGVVNRYYPIIEKTLVESFRKLRTNLQKTGFTTKALSSLKKTFSALFAGLKVGVKVFRGITDAIRRFTSALFSGSSGDIAEFFGHLADRITDFVETIDNSGLIEVFSTKIGAIAEIAGKTIREMTTVFASFFDGTWDGKLGSAFDRIRQILSSRTAGVIAAIKEVTGIDLSPIRDVFTKYFDIIANDDVIQDILRRLREMVSNITGVMGDLGEGFTVEKIQGLIDGLAETIDKVLSNETTQKVIGFLKNVYWSVTGFYDKISAIIAEEGFQGLFSRAVKFFEDLSWDDAEGGVAAAFAKLGDFFKSAVEKLENVLGTDLDDIFEEFLGKFQELTGIDLRGLVKFVNNVVDAFSWDMVIEKAGLVWEKITGFINGLFTSLGEFDFDDGLPGVVKGVLDTITTFIKTAISIVGVLLGKDLSTVEDGVDEFTSFWADIFGGKVFEDYGGGLEGVLGVLGTVLGAIGTTIGSVIDKIVGAETGGLGTKIEEIKNFLLESETVSAIAARVNQVWDSVTEFLGKFLDVLFGPLDAESLDQPSLFERILGSLGQALKGLFEGLLAFLSAFNDAEDAANDIEAETKKDSIWDTLAEAMEPVGKFFMNFGSNIGHIFTFIGDVAVEIGKAIAGMWETVKPVVDSIGNFLKPAVNMVVRLVTSVFDFITHFLETASVLDVARVTTLVLTAIAAIKVITSVSKIVTGLADVASGFDRNMKNYTISLKRQGLADILKSFAAIILSIAASIALLAILPFDKLKQGGLAFLAVLAVVAVIVVVSMALAKFADSLEQTEENVFAAGVKLLGMGNILWGLGFAIGIAALSLRVFIVPALRELTSLAEKSSDAFGAATAALLSMAVAIGVMLMLPIIPTRFNNTGGNQLKGLIGAAIAVGIIGFTIQQFYVPAIKTLMDLVSVMDQNGVRSIDEDALKLLRNVAIGMAIFMLVMAGVLKMLTWGNMSEKNSLISSMTGGGYNQLLTGEQILDKNLKGLIGASVAMAIMAATIRFIYVPTIKELLMLTRSVKTPDGDSVRFMTNEILAVVGGMVLFMGVMALLMKWLASSNKTSATVIMGVSQGYETSLQGLVGAAAAMAIMGAVIRFIYVPTIKDLLMLTRSVKTPQGNYIRFMSNEVMNAAIGIVVFTAAIAGIMWFLARNNVKTLDLDGKQTERNLQGLIGASVAMGIMGAVVRFIYLPTIVDLITLVREVSNSPDINTGEAIGILLGAMVGILAFMAGMALIMKWLAKANTITEGATSGGLKGLIGASLALGVLGLVLRVFFIPAVTDLMGMVNSWGDVGKLVLALVAIIGLVGGLLAVFQGVGLNPGVGATILAASAAFGIVGLAIRMFLVPALESLASIDLWSLAVATIALLGSMMGLMGILTSFGGNWGAMLAGSAAFVVVTMAIAMLLVPSLETLARLDVGRLVVASLALLAVVGISTGLMAAIATFTTPAAVAQGILMIIGIAGLFAAIRYLLVPSLQELGKMSSGDMVGAIMALTSMLVVITLLGLLVGLVPNMALGLIALGVAFALFSAGVLEMARAFGEIGPLFKSFAEDIYGIDATAVQAATNIAYMILALTAASVLDGIVFWKDTSSAIEQFGKDLEKFGDSVVVFSDKVEGIDDESVTAASAAGQMIAALATNLPVSEAGKLQEFLGDNSFEAFIRQLPKFGDAMTTMAAMLELGTPLDPIKVQAAADCAALIKQLATDLPVSEAGSLQKFLGDDSFEAFIQQIPKFGTAITKINSTFKDVVFDQSAFQKATQAAEYIQRLAAGGTGTTYTGGTLQEFFGDDSFEAFITNLEPFGKGIVALNKEVKGVNFDTAAINKSVEVASSLQVLANTPMSLQDGGLWQFLAGDTSFSAFLANIPTVGSSIYNLWNYVKDLTTSDLERVTTIVASVGSIAQAAKWAAEAGNAKDVLIKIGEGLNSLRTSIVNFDTVTKGISAEQFSIVTAGIKDLATTAKTLNQFTTGTEFATFAADIRKVGDEFIDNFILPFVSPNMATITGAAETFIGHVRTAIAYAIEGKDSSGNVKQNAATAATQANKYISAFANAFKATGVRTAYIEPAASVFMTVVEEVFNGLFTESAKEITQNFIAGLAAGLTDSTEVEKVVESSEKLASTIPDKISDRLEIKSPSRVAFALASYVDEGLVLGLEDGTTEVADAASEVGSALTEALEESTGGFNLWSIFGIDDKDFNPLSLLGETFSGFDINSLLGESFAGFDLSGVFDEGFDFSQIFGEGFDVTQIFGEGFDISALLGGTAEEGSRFTQEFSDMISGAGSSALLAMEQDGTLADGMVNTMDSALATLQNGGGYSMNIAPILDPSTYQNGIDSFNDQLTGMWTGQAELDVTSSLATSISSLSHGQADIFGEVTNISGKLDSLVERMTNLEIVMDSGVVVGELAPKVDAALGQAATYKARGN